MRKALLLTAVLATGAFAAVADDTYRLGFCDGEVTKDGIEVEGATVVEAAICLTAEDLARFGETSFAGVNAGLTTKLNANALTIWVRDALDGANLAETRIDIHTSPKPRDGWNKLTFETPVSVEAGKTYYVGYTINQTKTSSLVAYVPQPHPGASWLKTGEGAWTDLADTGAFCIEALLRGGTLPKNDLVMTSASMVKFDYVVADGDFTVSYSLHNAGIDTAYSYELTVGVPDTDISVTRTLTCQIAYGITRTFTETLSLPGLEPGKAYDIELKVSKPNGMDDEVETDNFRVITSVPVVSHTFPRTVLLEEFTTEECSNCPGAAEIVHEMLDGFSEADLKRFAMACHHAAYGTDFLTQDCDRTLTWFFNEYNERGQLLTYAPSFMLDREQAYDEPPTPVFVCPPLESFTDMIAEARDIPALYSIGFDATRDIDARTVEVRVSGERVLDVMKDPRITVYLVENDVLASRNGLGQKGTSGKEYWHQHVIRAYNSTWGDAPEWTGDSYAYSCTLTYGEECKPEDMQVMAFIANYDPENPVNCGVGNTAWESFVDIETVGVSGITTDADAETVVYDLSGRRIQGEDSLLPGIYVRRCGTKSEKILVR